MADTKLFDVAELESMKRAQLQKLCKKVGIKANSKTNELIENLREYAETNFKEEEEKRVFEGTSDEASPESTTCTSSSQDTEESACYKEQVMQQLERKVQETIKSAKYECKIPRFAQFANSCKDQKKTPQHGKNWSSVHGQLFEKMDSIEVYLEKKRKRTQSFYQNVKKAKITVSEAKSVVAEMKKSHNTPSAKVSSLSRRSLGKSTVAAKSVTISSKPTGFSFLKSATAFRTNFSGSGVPAVAKQKTPAARKSVAFMTSRNDENRTKTPGVTRKSVAGTPFRFSAIANTSLNTQASETKPKKFDLKASLAKPLSYTPHTGKLKTPPLTKKEPSVVARKLVVKPKVVDHKVDIKNVKFTSRADRRKAEMKNRTNKRKDAVARRRGLAA